MIAAAIPPLRPLPLGLLHHRGDHCPACGGRQFHVGRLTAECARCETALIVSRPQHQDTNP